MDLKKTCWDPRRGVAAAQYPVRLAPLAARSPDVICGARRRTRIPLQRRDDCCSRGRVNEVDLGGLLQQFANFVYIVTEDCVPKCTLKG